MHFVSYLWPLPDPSEQVKPKGREAICKFQITLLNFQQYVCYVHFGRFVSLLLFSLKRERKNTEAQQKLLPRKFVCLCAMAFLWNVMEIWRVSTTFEHGFLGILEGRSYLRGPPSLQSLKSHLGMVLGTLEQGLGHRGASNHNAWLEQLHLGRLSTTSTRATVKPNHNVLRTTPLVQRIPTSFYWSHRQGTFQTSPSAVWFGNWASGNLPSEVIIVTIWTKKKNHLGRGHYYYSAPEWVDIKMSERNHFCRKPDWPLCLFYSHWYCLGWVWGRCMAGNNYLKLALGHVEPGKNKHFILQVKTLSKEKNCSGKRGVWSRKRKWAHTCPLELKTLQGQKSKT